MVEPLDKATLAKLNAAQLVERLANADRDLASTLLEELARRFVPLMRWTWHRLGGRSGDYDDFQQTALIKLWQGLPQLDNPRNFPGYFKTVLYRTAIDFRRRSEQWVALDEVAYEEGHYPYPIPDTVEEEIDLAILIQSLQERLPPREAEVLRKTVIEGKTPSEIAQDWGITDGAVRMTISRGINKIRKILQER